jgi:hypothetical protein
MRQKETAMTRKSRIMIFGPKPDGTYVVEFRTAEGSPRPERGFFSGAAIDALGLVRAATSWFR